MEFIGISMIAIIVSIVLASIFDYNKKKLKTMADNKELDELAKKYPSNIEMCQYYLKKLNNETVTIEENEESEASLYIAITNKISIANISNTYTRIQTIAHECLHSIQNRKMLVFNFIFSNFYLLYFIIICVLAIFKILPYEMMFLSIFLILSLVYYMVRIYLENDAMIKARYLAKEYMEEIKVSTSDEIEQIVSSFDRLNEVGIKCVNYSFFLNIMIKVILFSIICMIR